MFFFFSLILYVLYLYFLFIYVIYFCIFYCSGQCVANGGGMVFMMRKEPAPDGLAL